MSSETYQAQITTFYDHIPDAKVLPTAGGSTYSKGKEHTLLLSTSLVVITMTREFS